MGLHRAFRTAGARSIVSSLWGVDDIVTANFMVMFYKHLWQGNGSPGDALRETQLWALRNPASLVGRRGGNDPNAEDVKLQSSPRAWASFVYWGR